MEETEELEIWSVWLGNDVIMENVEKSVYKMNELSVEVLKNFYESQQDYKCISVHR